ncbi:hypothetical protein E2C01_023911 [Portunus trituberculatus]|uniref:Uncharacterized protein n=1 Tax=Portunus trituberculatus TaxID=210409 RepID=A0A5B7ECG4_PORTR|nr:hypothetical protein [Portunus trituberculatus]
MPTRLGKCTSSEQPRLLPLFLLASFSAVFIYREMFTAAAPERQHVPYFPSLCGVVTPSRGGAVRGGVGVTVAARTAGRRAHL